MKRILLKIAYDGTDFHGWQYQPNAVTVQEVLQNALEEILGERPNITGCSRTDAGVHAKEFYCHLDCNDSLPKKAFIFGLNSILPNTISVLDCFDVDSDFHARYDAIGKKYVYNMYLGHTDPFLSRYALRLEKKPNIDLMNEFCKTVIGKHDFCGFSSSKRTVEDTIRTVTECYVTENDNKICFNISANGFLYNMVRILAGTALDVGYEKLSPNCAREIFATKKRELGGKTLKPCGLFLEKVFYNDLR